MILVSIGLAAFSGVPALFLKRFPRAGQRIATVLVSAGSIQGFCSVALFFFAAGSAPASLTAPFIGLDALSAFFLVPILLVGGLGSIYGLGYWPAEKHPGDARKVQAFWGSLVAGMSLLVIAKNTLVFLFGWEAMALSAFFLVSAEDQLEETRKAGWLYFIATHIGTLALFGLFAYWRTASGSFAMTSLPSGILGAPALSALFLVLLLGFGMKAGIMPMHFWLPPAHAAAPSHISAIMSGVVIKMGIYGLVRFLSLMPAPPRAWGGFILLLGMASGLLGVAFAIAQHDIKRLLAYHSVENIGIILMGLGLALLGRTADRPEWIVLGLAGCLLHVWNHSLFKALLFLGAGSLVHSTGTRQIDRLGALAKKMPWTAALFLVGAVAICGLPPLNGFVSELFVYLGLFKTIAGVDATGSAAILAAPVLAMIGALAVACFVKVYGTVFLGNPRGPETERAHEAPLSMRLPMVVLAVLCFAIALFPSTLVPLLDAAIAVWMQPAASLSVASLSAPSLATLVPLVMISELSIALAVVILVLSLPFFLRSRSPRKVGTWDCGYAQPTGRMQYTASSFAQSIIGHFRWALRPHEERPEVEGPFPASASMSSHVDDTVLDRLLLPAARSLQKRFAWIRRFQQGLTQYYLLYVLVIVVLMLSTLIPVKEVLVPFFTR